MTHITDEKSIDADNKRHRKFKTDALRVRGMGMSLVLQGKEMKNMTDFEALFDVLPLLKNEKKCTYKFSGYKDTYEKLYPWKY